MKVRHFGCMNANCRIQTDTIRQMITAQTGASAAKHRHPTGAGDLSSLWRTLIVLSRVWPVQIADDDTG